ncbi:MAG: DJ-1/PfpI family protein [Thermoplasmatota archaeon]
MYKIAIMVFPDAEELDFVGPFETLASVDKLNPNSVKVELVGKYLDPVKGSNGLRVLPDRTFSENEQYDILIIPGGQGRKKAMYDAEVLKFVKDQMNGLSFLCSVCTGAFVLAEAGVINGLKATTHHTALDELQRSYPDVEVLEKRVVKNDTEPKIWLAGGVSSGIDLSLELIGELFDDDLRKDVAKRLEYHLVK